MIVPANNTHGPRLLDLFFEHYYPRKLRATSKKNTRLFSVSLSQFARFLNHTPLTSHLTDEILENFCYWVVESGRSPYTANCYRSKLVALWNHLARLRIVEKFPTMVKLKEPHRIPRAWSPDQLSILFQACQDQTGKIGNAPAALWWHALHAVIWDTGERISATLSLKWDELAWDTRVIVSKAENRKGGKEDKAFKLHKDTIAILRKLRQHSTGQRIFQANWCEGTVYNRYRRLLEGAGLPSDRNHKFHCLRRSVASYFEAAGGDATKLLGHSARRVTERSYLDPTITETKHACEMLFRPAAPKPGPK